MSFNEGCRLLSVDQLVRVVLPSASPDALLTEEIDDCLFALHRQLTCASDQEAKLTVHLRRRKPQRGVRIEIRNGELKWIQLSADARVAVMRATLVRVLGVLLDALACFRPEQFANPGEEAVSNMLDAAQVAAHVSAYVERRCRKEDDGAEAASSGPREGARPPAAKRAKKSVAAAAPTPSAPDVDAAAPHDVAAVDTLKVPTVAAPPPVATNAPVVDAAPLPVATKAPTVDAPPLPVATKAPAVDAPPPPAATKAPTVAAESPTGVSVCVPAVEAKTQGSADPAQEDEEEDGDHQLRLVAWMLRNRGNLAAALYEARALPRVTRQEAERLEDAVAGYPALERARQRAMGREPLYPAPASRAQFNELRRVYVEALAVYAAAPHHQ